ncbi:MAG: hypothetical protein NC079_03045 [Clostridium sp.]|nr:hypothetical protein [Acetatifactor muris]MCM1525892.1 hypothetical protein [Bacteroides sp.]MCM1562568.1 hypothetical protein [Clostridium sp.]
MSHTKFYTILGFLSLGCGVLSLMSLLLPCWITGISVETTEVIPMLILLYLFGLSVLITLVMLFLAWLYGEKHVAKWKAWHALGIPVVGVAAAAIPWVLALLFMRA